MYVPAWKCHLDDFHVGTLNFLWTRKVRGINVIGSHFSYSHWNYSWNKWLVERETVFLQIFFRFCILYMNFAFDYSTIVKGSTLDTGINVSPGITVAPYPHIKIFTSQFWYFFTSIKALRSFYLFFLQNFSKINKRSPMFIPESRVIRNHTLLLTY